MAAVDVFDREVKASIEELRAALVGDVAKDKKGAQREDENTEQLKKLNDNLQRIVGDQLDRELKALNKLIKKVADCCEDMAGKRSSRDVNREAKAFGEAVAKSMNPAVGNGIEKAIEDAIEDMAPAFENVTDKTMTFGKVLERSQRRFSTAFGMIGKDFQRSFSEAFRNRIAKLNPFKWFEKSGEKAAEDSRNILTEVWQKISTTVSNLWSGVTDKVSGWWKSATDKVSGLWSGVTNKVSGLWNSVAKKVSDSWIGQQTAKVAKGAGFLARSVGTLGKATAGTVKDLFGLGKTRPRGQADVEGGATSEAEAMAETLVNEMGKDDLQLCQCICKCIHELMGVTEKGVAAEKKSGGFVEKLFKGDKKAKSKEDGKGAKSQASLLGSIGAGIKGLLGRGKGGESQEALMREYLQQQRKEKFARAGQGARTKAISGASAASRMVFGDKPVESMLAGVAQGVAKVGGKVIEGPFWALGELVEKSTIPGLTALGPVIKFVGAALGGLAEGLINFVLTPLIEQVEYMDEATKAMYISTGATTSIPGIKMGGAPPPGTGEEWSDIAKRVAESNKNMDSSARTLEKLGTYMSDVGETGQRFNVIQKTTLRNFKRGIQDTKTLNKVTKTGLQTAYLIGASAESTSELFADWHQRLGMSTIDLRGMQRNLTQIGRSTGIFGDELVQIAKSSHQFMENLRMAGNLSTTAAKNILELSARGRKTGTEAATGRTLDFLSKGILRGGGGPKEQALGAIGSGGRPDLARKVLEGTLMDTDEDFKAFGQNLENWTRKLIKADPTKSLEENIKRLTPSQRARYTAIMEQTVGVGLNEMGVLLGNIKETTKSFSERIADFSKAARGPTMSLEDLQGVMDKGGAEWRKTFDKLVAEKGDIGKAIDEMLNMEKLPQELRKQLEGQLSAQQAAFQKQQLFLKTGADLLDAFNASIKDGGKDFDEAIKELAGPQGSKNFQEYLKAIGGDVANGGAAIEKVLADQAKRMREEAKKLGKEEIVNILPTPEEIQKALAGKKPEDMTAIVEKFTRVQGLIAKQGMQASNPVEDIKQNVHLIEAHFKQLMQSAIFQALPFLTEAIKQLNEAPFWKAFKEGDIKKGVELLGEFLANMAGDIEKAMAQVASIADTPGFQKFISGLVSGIATIAKPLLEAIGNYIKENAGGIAKFLEQAIKFFNETDWEMVGKALGMILAALVAIGAAVAVGGALLLGLTALSGGLGGLLLALGGGALVAGIVALALAFKDLDNAKNNLNKTIQKGIEFDQKRTDKSITDNKDLALQGNVSALEARRAALLREEATVVTRIEKNKDKKVGLFGGNAEEVAQVTADRARKTQIDKEKTALEEQLKVAKAQEADKMKTMKGSDLANKQMEDYWNIMMKKQREQKGIQDKQIEERNALHKRVAELDDMTWWTGAEKRERAEKAARRDQLNETLEETQKRLWKPFQHDAQRVYDNTWHKALSMLGNESADQKYVRQRYGISTVDQRKQGVDRGKLGKDYEGLADILWEKGPEAAMDYIKKNAKSLNMDIVQSMLNVYGSKLPVEMAKNLKTAFAQQDYNDLTKKAVTAGLIDPKKEGLTDEQFLRAREVARKRGVDTPDTQDIAKVLQNPETVKLTKEQLDFLVRARDVLKDQLADVKKRAGEATGSGKTVLDNMAKNLQEQIDKSISPTANKEIEEMAKKASNPGSIYTHDTHLEKLLEDMLANRMEITAVKGPAFITPATDGNQVAVSSMLPGSAKGAEDEMRRRQAESSGSDVDMARTEANTGTTAANTRAMVKLLGRIGRLLAKRGNNGNCIQGVQGVDYPTEAFFDEILSTEWPGARIGRTVGLEIDYTDLS